MDVQVCLSASWRAAVDSGPPSTSGRLSRSYTIAAALCRLGKIPSGTCQSLEVHILGADRTEGCDAASTAAHFAPLCQWLHNRGVTRLHLLLNGPHLPAHLHGTQHSDVNGADDGDAASLIISYDTSLYHERGPVSTSAPLAAVFCFNAGVWGYDSWMPSLAAAAAAAPVVVTSYNGHEAADDLDTLEDAVEESLAGCRFSWHWRPEKNPFASQLTRPHCTVANRTLADNSHWQCFYASEG